MDQRASAVKEDLKDILKTRLALADKVHRLEQRVDEKVQEAKTAALDMIDHAKDTAVDFVESTTRMVSPTEHAGRRPWVFLGSAIAIGLVAGWMNNQRKASGVYAYYPPKAQGADVRPSQGVPAPQRNGVYPFNTEAARGQSERPSEQKGTAWELLKPVTSFPSLLSLVGNFTGEFAKERDRLQGALLRTGQSFAQDMARIAVQSLIDSIGRGGPARPSRLRSQESGENVRSLPSTH